jgi:hypothetical protein
VEVRSLSIEVASDLISNRYISLLELFRKERETTIVDALRLEEDNRVVEESACLTPATCHSIYMLSKIDKSGGGGKLSHGPPT